MKKYSKREPKTVGVVRAIDSLGRITLPKEMRDMLNIAIGDSLSISVRLDEDKPYIILESLNLQQASIKSLQDNVQSYFDAGKISSDKKSEYEAVLNELHNMLQ